MTIPFSLCLIRRSVVFSSLALACLLLWTRQPVNAQGVGQPGCLTNGCPPGSTCATYTIWDTGSDINVRGFNPQSIQDDVAGMTNQFSPAAPTMVTAMENTCNGSSGLLYWSPTTNAFKTFCVTPSSGNEFQFSVDLNRSSSSVNSQDGYARFGGGDVWATVHSNADFAPYMNFRGSGNFTRWNVGADRKSV